MLILYKRTFLIINLCVNMYLLIALFSAMLAILYDDHFVNIKCLIVWWESRSFGCVSWTYAMNIITINRKEVNWPHLVCSLQFEMKVESQRIFIYMSLGRIIFCYYWSIEVRWSNARDYPCMIFICIGDSKLSVDNC